MGDMSEAPAAPPPTRPRAGTIYRATVTDRTAATPTGLPAPTTPLRFGQREVALLHALNRYHFLTAPQCARLLSRTGGLGLLTRVQDKLKRLTEAGYLARQRLLPPDYGGRGGYCYTLATVGRNVLVRLGATVRPRFRPGEVGMAAHNILFLEHTLAVNDVLLAAELLARHHPDRVRLDELRHERDLKRAPIRVTVTTGGHPGQQAVIPDGWVNLAYPVARERHCLLLELDRDSEHQPRWKRKVHGLLALLLDDASGTSPYGRAFGADLPAKVMVATTAGPRRAAALRSWTELALAEADATDLADLFFFTAASPTAETPHAFYTAAHWHQPFASAPTGLLPVLPAP